MYFYPRPLRRGRRVAVGGAVRGGDISIHALFAEGDHAHPARPLPRRDFYPRPLRRGRRPRCTLFPRSRHFYPRPLRRGRPEMGRMVRMAKKFLSTPSSQRATPPCRFGQIQPRNFYPRPLRRGRPSAGYTFTWDMLFLSTPSSQRATALIAGVATGAAVFLSTPSSQRATGSPTSSTQAVHNFYPRPLRRGRR